MKSIGVLTYDTHHRKTYDTLCLLKAVGYKNVVVFARPHHYKKKFEPIYFHRPVLISEIRTEEVCKNFGYKYISNELNSDYLEKGSIVLICGAGIIEKNIVEDYIVINSHPGYIPNCRGLDALKWAIVEKQPIGVTTHQIGEFIDAGKVFDRKLIPLYKNDTFHALSQRVYETEVIMLVEAIKKVNENVNMILPGEFELHKRMPKYLEKQLLAKFEEIKNERGEIYGN